MKILPAFEIHVFLCVQKGTVVIFPPKNRCSSHERIVCMPEFTVKCSLARLGALPQIRKEIDKQVATHHALGLRGFHVATHTALRELKTGGVFDQSWWNRCFNSCGTLRGRRNICTKDAAIEQSIQELFGGASPIDADRAWPFINELSKSAVTMTQNMMAANFHTQLTKAMRREIIVYEWAHDIRIDKNIKRIIILHYARSVCGCQRLLALPDSVPVELIEQLQALIALWKDKFSSNVPSCPTETFIYNQKARLDSGRKFLTGIWDARARVLDATASCRVSRASSNIAS